MPMSAIARRAWILLH